MAIMTKASTEAFAAYCADPVVRKAIDLIAQRGGTLAIDLLRDCFMAGAKHGAEPGFSKER